MELQLGLAYLINTFNFPSESSEFTHTFLNQQFHKSFLSCLNIEVNNLVNIFTVYFHISLPLNTYQIIHFLLLLNTIYLIYRNEEEAENLDVETIFKIK